MAKFQQRDQVNWIMNVLAESPVYKQILDEGWQKGRQEGQQEGWQRGHHEGLIAAVKLGLELRFGGEGMALFPSVERCSDLSVLTQAQEAIRNGRDLPEIKGLF